MARPVRQSWRRRHELPSKAVRFTPSKKGNLKGMLTVVSGATTSPDTIKVSGKGK